MIGLRNSNNSSPAYNMQGHAFPRGFIPACFRPGPESSEQTFLIRSFFIYWIPACAGMTNEVAVHSVISVSSVANS